MKLILRILQTSLLMGALVTSIATNSNLRNTAAAIDIRAALSSLRADYDHNRSYTTSLLIITLLMLCCIKFKVNFKKLPRKS